MCRYYIVFTPKYRRKVIYNQYKEVIRDIIKQLCSYKGVEIIEGHLMPDHIHILISIGTEGYAECERVFCVRGILELCADEKYRKFLSKRILEVEDLSLYEEVLEKLRTIRKTQMTERLEAMKKV